jgi:UDP-N-acetylglucosamine/UDP-N-acetylgalactosamine diphosphorylase
MNAQALIDRGVVLKNPLSVEIADSIVPEKIAGGVIIHSGCRLSGAQTSIGHGSIIGCEAPATIDDCQIGRNVELKGGFFSGATFLDNVSIGSGAQVRPGTLLEEESGVAHTAGFKQTIFLPFVTAGSLINFCDALMAGGTSRKNHSEIGSSYIHFNFTPNQDKATASLFGDVPRGVFLDQPPVFLGGQGGVVGPARITYGVVIPAGAICRNDALNENTLFVPRALHSGSSEYITGAYRNIHRTLHNNLIYIGNLRALLQWYRRVRLRTMTGDPFIEACHSGAIRRIESGIDERIKRLGELAEKMPFSVKCIQSRYGAESQPKTAAQQQTFFDRWPEMEACLRKDPGDSVGAADRNAFLSAWEKTPAEGGHIEAVRSLSAEARETGVKWLQSIVDATSAFISII